MRRAGARLAILALTVALGGCGLEPFGAVDVAPVEGTGVRITEGSGSSSRYTESTRVAPGNVVQFETTLGDARTAIVTVPRGPATELVVGVRLEGSSEVLGTATLLSLNGLPVRLGEPFGFDPSYVGIERHSDGERIELRLAVPRLAGTGRDQVTFTFKVPVR